MLWIIVDDGKMFEGDVNHWQDCFFTIQDQSDAKNCIQIYCDLYDMKVVFEDR